MTNNVMTDKEYINDSVASQKLVASAYNTYANECVNVNLRNAFLNILREEHDIQNELYTEMQSRGWYQPEPADQNKINKTKSKFTSM